MADTRQRLLEAGFDDYLAKPFHGRALTELVTSWLARRAAEGTRAVAPPAAPPDPTAGRSVEESPELDLVVLDELAKLDPEGMEELLRLFTEEGRARLVALKAAVESGEAKLAAGMAHALAGGAASLGAAQLAAAAKALEQDVRAGELHGAQRMEELERLFDRSIGALRRQLVQPPLRAA
jgi:HPt (histidine-containing phosphotransfer) domain-containing protein